jgi:hypothetical protein
VILEVLLQQYAVCEVEEESKEGFICKAGVGKLPTSKKENRDFKIR